MDKLFHSGVIIGKFLPPHLGHEYLIRFGLNTVEQLTVLVDNVPNQYIEPEQRKMWLEELFAYDIMKGRLVVKCFNELTPQEPHEHPDFWNYWKNIMIEKIGYKPDCLIAGMEYGVKLSDTIGCYFLPHDITRSGIDICATVIRQNPFAYWDKIIEPARPYFVKKVCLVGPESSGKTTLAQQLAQHYQTLYVPEYAQTFLSIKREIHYEDLIKFAHCQIACEKSLSRRANKILFCDSDILTTQLWSDTLYQKHDDFFDFYQFDNNYELHLLCYPDIEWVKDNHREVLDEEKAKSFETRLTFFNQMEDLLKKRNLPYIIIKGQENRFNNALIEVSKLFNH